MGARGRTLVAAASSLTLLAGCAGASHHGSGQSATPSSTSASRSVSSFMAALGGEASDHNPEDSPQSMAEHSGAVVEGRIVALDEGRSYGSAVGAPDTVTLVAATVDVTRTLMGPSATTMHVELDVSSIELEEMRAALPTSATGIFYLTDWSSPSASTGILTPDGGRPAGQPMYALASPQGAVLPDGESAVEIMTGTVYPDTSITDLMPGQTDFPPSEDDI